MAQVWECDLPFNKAWVLMAMADHADHEGKNVFPALPLVAWKTGYSHRQIKRIVADLRDDGILLPYDQTAFGVKIYEIKLEHIPRKPKYVPPENGRPEGVPENAPRKQGGQFVPGFYVPHNHQSSINNSESSGVTVTSLNSKDNYQFPKSENAHDFDEGLFGEGAVW